MSRLSVAVASMAVLLSAAPAAQAGEVYGTVGVPGLMLGYAQPLNNSWGWRVDAATLGTQTRNTTENNVKYDGKLKANRLGVFADWFPQAGGFRLSGGLTFNDYRFDLDASSSQGTVIFGNTVYDASKDGLKVAIDFPKVTPYLGLGWGHHATGTRGWRGALDLGAMIGKAKVTSTPRGNVTQDDADRETQELRDGVGNVKAIPQISFSVGYDF